MTDAILGMLDDGVVPWRRPWAVRGEGPRNIETGKAYRGGNFFLLGIVAMVESYSTDIWGTYRQIKAAGGQVRKGEKATHCAWYGATQVRGDDGEPLFRDGEPVMRSSARSFCVFNLDQCDGLDHLKEERGEVSMVSCSEIVDGMPAKPEISHRGDRAFYSPSLDKVTVPVPARFEDEAEYWATMFHELAHSTGHSSRLDRHPGGWASVGSDQEQYSEEELVAEFCSSFLCGSAGVERNLQNSAAYVAGWKRRISSGDVSVTKALTAAAKAADYILCRKES